MSVALIILAIVIPPSISTGFALGWLTNRLPRERFNWRVLISPWWYDAWWAQERESDDWEAKKS